MPICFDFERGWVCNIFIGSCALRNVKPEQKYENKARNLVSQVGQDKIGGSVRLGAIGVSVVSQSEFVPFVPVVLNVVMSSGSGQQWKHLLSILARQSLL